MNDRWRDERDEEPDLVDRIPFLGDASSRLERSLGPSCFLSLVIVFLLLFAFRRLLGLPPLVLLIVVGLVWFAVLTVLVRAKPIRFPEPDDDDR